MAAGTNKVSNTEGSDLSVTLFDNNQSGSPEILPWRFKRLNMADGPQDFPVELDSGGNSQVSFACYLSSDTGTPPTVHNSSAPQAQPNGGEIFVSMSG